MTKLKHPGGRPTLYRREVCDRLIEAMAKGLTAEAAAARIGISARSLFYWQKEHAKFLQAIQEQANSPICLTASTRKPSTSASRIQ